MKWLVCSLVSVGLLVACEKAVPFENTRPLPRSPSLPTVPSFDAGLRLLDAQLPPPPVDSGVEVAATGEFSKPGLLKAIADCSLGRYREFNERALALRDAVRAWSESPTDDKRAGAQTALLAAMDSWQTAELFRFGPSGPASEPGGRDLRNEIYFFPDLNDCLVDQTLVNKNYEKRPLGLSLSAKGLGALEHLLFDTDTTNSCSSVVTINTPSSALRWDMLDAAELNRRRAAYAASLVEDLTVQAGTLLAAWEPAQGNFVAQFSQAGAGSQTFAQEQAAFNVVDNAMFYWDKELKDFKVAIPVGLSLECTTGRCPERVESRLSAHSNQNMLHNIRGFRLLFEGCGSGYGGLGFDDYLRAIGKAELAERMLAAIIASEQAVQQLPATLETLVVTNPELVLALHAALKGISDPLKSEFVTVLNLELPAAAQGDND